MITGKEIRRIILQQSRRANVGHIGSALSIADVVAAIYSGVMSHPAGHHDDRDRFILSKGHASLALYAALYLSGRMDKQSLDTYCGDDSWVGVHPERSLNGVDFSTGSLGQGLSFGTGAALAARWLGSTRRVLVLLSDAECNEGSVWEAAMFGAHHRLSNLTAIIDLNGQQAFGYTRDVIAIANMAERWTAFGWEVHEVDGHEENSLRQLLSARSENGLPRMILARTTFGKGVSYMEGQIRWHYLPMSASEFEQAITEVENGP